jgi:hypothetical protein
MRCGLTQPVGFDTAVKNYNSPYETKVRPIDMPVDLAWLRRSEPKSVFKSAVSLFSLTAEARIGRNYPAF